jgi:quercetin dioxygenase-like cupin family protein
MATIMAARGPAGPIASTPPLRRRRPPVTAARASGGSDRNRPVGEELEIGTGTRLRVLSRSEELLELEASYDGGGSPPPAHLHPEQDERFEVLAGAMTARVSGRERELSRGAVLEVPRGTPHQMWNAGGETAVMRWSTTPAGRTLEWFRELAALARGEQAGDPATLLERYRDVFRLAGG